MPIYEYHCEACGNDHEALQKIADEPLTVCPNCGAERLKKKVSAPSFRLSGSGWYETDFKTGKKKNLAGDSDNKGSSSGDSSKAASQTSDAGTKTAAVKQTSSDKS
jgi:putative FmdB family regulatory protein